MKKVKLNLQNFIILFFTVLVCSIFLGFYLKNINLKDSIDYKIMFFIQSNNIFTKSSILLNFIKFITTLGNSRTYLFLFIPFGIYFYYNNLKKEFVFLAIVLIFTFALNELIKLIVSRQRPIEFFVINMNGFSYPSGHSMNFSSFYLTFRFLLREKLNSKIIDVIVYILIFLVAISRVILGVHWPIDVVIGFILGYFCYNLAKRLYFSFWRS